MDNRQPIEPLTMYRSILGRADERRGNRIIVIEGDIIGSPYDELDLHKKRNLMRQALDFGPDKETAMKVYISRVSQTDSAFSGYQANKTGVDYLNSTFVRVEDANGDEHTCLHLIKAGECPEADEYAVYDGEENVLIAMNLNHANVESIDAYETSDTDSDTSDYELAETEHYYITDDGIVLRHDTWLGDNMGEDGDEWWLVIYFDNDCPPITVHVEHVAADDSSDDTEGEET